MEEHSLNTGTVTINYAEVPSSGPPLVMLHRTSCRWQGMTALFPDLAPDWHIYAPDLRGHGGSGWAPGHYRLRDYADDVVALLERRVPGPAVLFGHSLGGIVAIEVAARMLLPSATHVRLKGIGHGLHGESKQPVVEAIKNFLGSLL